MKFNKIDLKEGDWFDRKDFTSDQLQVIKANYNYLTEETFTCLDTTLVSLQAEGCTLKLGYVFSERLDDEDKQYKVTDFFPETTESTQPITSVKAPVSLSDVTSLVQGAIAYITIEDGSYTVAPRNNDVEYKVSTEEDLFELVELLTKLEKYEVV